MGSPAAPASSRWCRRSGGSTPSGAGARPAGVSAAGRQTTPRSSRTRRWSCSTSWPRPGWRIIWRSAAGFTGFICAISRRRTSTSTRSTRCSSTPRPTWAPTGSRPTTSRARSSRRCSARRASRPRPASARTSISARSRWTSRPSTSRPTRTACASPSWTSSPIAANTGRTAP